MVGRGVSAIRIGRGGVVGVSRYRAIGIGIRVVVADAAVA